MPFNTLKFITHILYGACYKRFEFGILPTLTFKIGYDSIAPKTMNTIFLSRYFLINCMTQFRFKKEMFEKHEILNIATF